MKKIVLFAAAAVLAGCGTLSRGDRMGAPISREVVRSERLTLESHTQSRLAAIEQSINDYIQAKGVIPHKLDLLIPDYLAEVPEPVLGIAEHRKIRHKVQYYTADVIRDGQIDGSKIDDTGAWGYAYNDRQVIVFVDCTHKRLDGNLWYQMRGVY